MFGLAFGQKDEQFSVISVPRTSGSEWVVEKDIHHRDTEDRSRRPEAGGRAVR
jgi:hypothetical protein